MKCPKFNDPAAILLCLCLPFDREENALLLRKSVEFKKNEQYRRAYITVLTRFYLDNFSDIRERRYTLRHFKELDEKFETELQNNVSGDITLLPEYTAVSKGETVQNKYERIKNILKKIKGKEPS